MLLVYCFPKTCLDKQSSVPSIPFSHTVCEHVGEIAGNSYNSSIVKASKLFGRSFFLNYVNTINLLVNWSINAAVGVEVASF